MTHHTVLEPPYLRKRFEYSCKVIDSLRRALKETVAPLVGQSPLTVVAVGSYGRREASCVSDIDFFIVHDGRLPDERLEAILNQVNAHVRPLSQRGESDHAKFGRDALSLYSSLSCHMGWKRESSTALTRRMLLLLEGCSLFGDAAHDHWKNDLLRRYVPGEQGTGLSRFMLNDLVRYYRTLMANFEEKQAEGKAWGVRNIKLQFSRKLLFIGGIVVIAEAFGLPAHARVRRFEYLLAHTPLQRLATIGQSNEHTEQLFEWYAVFLKLISSAHYRQHLDQLSAAHASADPVYREIKAIGNAFSEKLEQWLRAQYPGHPILHALCF
ncbi:DUF294 nucleotidyltransferase-like domain-containing protein [Pseudomonas sp. NPDC089408]|uniref:DUF294 nucleotidyltransferase-like domain-containing protein n=1 Tax=Pseudomonas sp. NPDC089408 TaxID=3364465 RepID=UPI003805138F